MTLFTRLRRLAASCEGATATEFALVAAFFILPLTLAVYDFGTALHNDMQVGNAARAGAQFVNVNGYSSSYNTSTLSCSASNFTCAVQGATSLGNKVAVSVGAPYCGCQSGSTYTSASFSPPCNVCTGSSTTGCCPSGQTALTLAKVSASYTYKPIFNYLGLVPSSGFALSAATTALVY